MSGVQLWLGAQKTSACIIRFIKNSCKLAAMNISNQQRFATALAQIDALNQLDPNRDVVDGKPYPKELLYAERMSAMLGRYTPDASEALQLAARCQHVQRWKIARSSYPMTKAGYYQWRTELKSFHAEVTRQMLAEAGYDAAVIDRVCALVKKAAPANDPVCAHESQTLEDVVVLVFLESYLEQFVASHTDYDQAKFIGILNKTLRKTSLKARQAALSMLEIAAGLKPLLEQLITSMDT